MIPSDCKLTDYDVLWGISLFDLKTKVKDAVKTHGWEIYGAPFYVEKLYLDSDRSSCVSNVYCQGIVKTWLR